MLGSVGHRLTDDECRAIVEGTVELVVIFDTSGTIRFANEVALDVLGGAAEDYIGRNVVEFAHPDELERALQTLAMSSRFGSIPGATHFRLRRTDGSYAIIELSTGVIDGPEPLRFALGRAADHNVALAYTVHHLAAGMDVAEALRSTLDVFGWRAVDTQVCVLWRASDGTDRWVSTGLPPALTGQGAPPDSMLSLIHI